MESPPALPTSQLPPAVACHMGSILEWQYLLITKHPRHSNAIKDRVEWTNQREGLYSYHGRVGVYEKEREKKEGSERKDMGLTQDSLLQSPLLQLWLLYSSETWEQSLQGDEKTSGVIVWRQAGNLLPCTCFRTRKHHPQHKVSKYLTLHTFSPSTRKFKPAGCLFYETVAFSFINTFCSKDSSVCPS